MHPVLFWIGSFPIHGYGAMGALAFVVGAGICLLRGTRQGMDRERLADVIFWMAITSLLGARVVFLLQNPQYVHSVADLFDMRGGGLVFYGSFLVGIPVGFALMRRYRLPAFAVWDIFATAFPLSHAISRIGCFLAGCCYGLPTDVPWAVTFPADQPLAPPGIPLHPTQLYEAGALLLIGLATNLFHRHRKFDGQVFLLYLVLYAIARAALESFRGDVDRGWFLPEVFGEALSFSQGMSVVFAGVALVVFFWGARRQARRDAERLAVGASIRGPVAPDQA
ncbi:MAG: prolipoprotein diacylglyceryl transferase [Myxococcota bacterium]